MGYITLSELQSVPDEQKKKRGYVTLSELRGPEPIDVNPASGMSTLDLVRAGAGKAFYDLARGAGQWLGAVDRKDVEESRRLDRSLMDTTSGKVGNFGGNVALLAPTALIPGANTLTGAATVGAIAGAMQPSVSTKETIGNVGVGAVGGAVVPAAITAGKVAKSFIEPLYESGRQQIVGRAITSAAGNQADDALRNLTAGRQSVPGSMPTAAEVANNPGIAALQRTAVQTNPVAAGEMHLIQQANNDARIEVLKRIIGDPTVMREERAAATNALYQLASGRKIEITPELDALFKRPIMQSAIGEAKTLAANEGRVFGFNTGTPPQPSTVLDVNGMPAMVTPGKPGTLLGIDAHTMKRSLDDAIEGLAGQSGLPQNAKRAAGDTKAAFLDQIEKQLPEYRKARETFSAMSRPINQAEVADLILQRSAGGIQGNMSPAAFNRALNDRTAQSALGRKSATLESTFTPEQLSALNGVKADLKGLDFANSAGRLGGGSDTVQKLAYVNMMDRAGIPNAVRGFAPAGVLGNVVGRAGDVIYADANRKLSAMLAQSLLSPKEAAKLMKAGATPKGLLQIEEAAIRAGLPLTGGLLGSLDWAQ